jgi:hypothetical protein
MVAELELRFHGGFYATIYTSRYRLLTCFVRRLEFDIFEELNPSYLCWEERSTPVTVRPSYESHHFCHHHQNETFHHIIALLLQQHTSLQNLSLPIERRSTTAKTTVIISHLEEFLIAYTSP